MLKVLIVDEYKPTYDLINLFFQGVKKERGLEVEIDWIHSYQKGYEHILTTEYDIVISEINYQYPLDNNPALEQQKIYPNKLSIIFTSNEVKRLISKYHEIEVSEVPVFSKADFSGLKALLTTRLDELIRRNNV